MAEYRPITLSDVEALRTQSAPAAQPRTLSPRQPTPADFPRETPQDRAAATNRQLAVLEHERARAAPEDHPGLDREIARAKATGAVSGQGGQAFDFESDDDGNVAAVTPAGGPAAAPRAAKTPKWSDIEASPKYQALDSSGKESVRMSFWRDVVSPLVPTAELEQARKTFDERTKPSLVSRAVKAVKGMAAAAQGGPQAPLAQLSDEMTVNMQLPEDGPPGEQGEFSKGLRTGFSGMHQMGTAAAMTPVVAGLQNVDKQLALYDRIDAGQYDPVKEIRPRLGRTPTYAEQEAIKYANAKPEDRKALRENALQTVGDLDETKRTLMEAWNTYSADVKMHTGKVPEFTEAYKTGEFGKWFAFNFGQALPYSAAFIMTGMAGGTPAMVAAGTALGAGDIASGQLEAGRDINPERAAAGAVPYGAMEFIGVPAQVVRAFRGVTPAFLAEAAKSYFVRAGRAVPEAAVREFVNEAGQEIIKDVALNEKGGPIVTEDALTRWFNSGMAGAAGGAPFGAVAAARGPAPAAGQPAPEQGPAGPGVAAEQQDVGQNAPEIPPEAAAGIDVGSLPGNETAAGLEKPSVGPAEAPAGPPAPPAAPAPAATPAPAAEAPAAPEAPARPQPGAPAEKPGRNLAKEPPAGGIDEAAAGLKKLFESPVDEAAHGAATSPANELPEPTEPQKEAGNYQKGHVRIGGLDISIENPEGSKRRPEWPTLASHYGYIRGTVGKDKDHVDVFIKPGTPQDLPGGAPVFVVDQKKQGNGHFDEHKVMLGYESEAEAREAYLANYTPGWDGIRDIVEMDLAEFRRWLDQGDTRAPAANTRPAGEAEVLTLPMLGKGPGYKGVPSAAITLQKYGNGLWAGSFDFDTNNGGEGNPNRWSDALHETREEALADTLRRLRERVDSYRPMASEQSNQATPKHLAHIRKWIDELEGKKPTGGGAPPAKGGGIDLVVQPLRPGAKPEIVTVPEKPARDSEWREVGKNADGETLYANARGIRSIVRNGVRVTETVGIRPTHGGIETVKEPHKGEFRTKEEADAEAVRGDQGQAAGEGRAGAEGKGDRGRDVQQPAPKPADEPRAPGGGAEKGTAATEPGEEDVRAKRLNGDERRELIRRLQGMMRVTAAGFATISEARAFAREVLGRPVPAGSVLAKEVDEAIEQAVVRNARDTIETVRKDGHTDKALYVALRELYERQPNLGVRTSTSIEQQAYSTPVPLAFIASRLAGIDKDTRVLEPTAGNGMLLIEADPDKAVANELNAYRYDALRQQGFTPSRIDATALPTMEPVDAVIANPPFGYVKDSSGRNREWKINHEYTTNQVDHAIVFKALAAMKDDGRAVLIVGAPREGEADGYRGVAKRSFYFTLYRDYNVVDHFTVSGDLYKKQGAAWPVDVIVIDGRGKSELRLPQAVQPKVYETWDALTEKLDAAARRPDAGARPGARAPEKGAGGRAGAPAGEGGPGLGPVGDRRPHGGSAAERQPSGERHGERAGADDDRGDAGRDAGARAGRGDVRGPGRSADTGGAGQVSPKAPAPKEDVGAVFDEEFSKLFGDVEKAPARGEAKKESKAERERREFRELIEQHYTPGNIIFESYWNQHAKVLDFDWNDGYWNVTVVTVKKQDNEWAPVDRERNHRTPPDRADKVVERGSQRVVGEAAKSAARETVAGLEDVAKGLTELFGGKGRVGSGLQFDEETYAKAKPFFIAGIQHFKQAAADIREAIRLLLLHLREKAAMTAEAIGRMKPYVVRFMEDVKAGRIPELVAKRTPGARPQEAETEHQRAYAPKSTANSIGSLVPANMQAATAEALAALEKRVGDLDQFVANELGYKTAELPAYFSAEQVDALALAIDSMQRGSGFIIGDQTGIGKGRVNAGIIRWAMKTGKTPIFVTEKPNLYGDIMRDLADIGMPKAKPVMTNNDADVPLDDEAALYFAEHEAEVEKAKAAGEKPPRMPKVDARPGKWMKTGRQDKLLTELINSGSLGAYDVIFTTYNQMQSVKEKYGARHDFLRAFADGAIVLFDESHNAGGTEAKEQDEARKKNEGPKRSDFARDLLQRAAAVFYSSATYAKRPSVMDLYFRTDMSKAVASIKSLVSAIQDGGVPLQQVVAAMLAKAGQYIRREKSFAGIDYDTATIKVNREVAEQVSSIMRAITDFDHAKAAAVEQMAQEAKDEAKNITEDGSIGQAGAHSTNFTSLMHNIVNQMLLALKTAEIGDEVIASIKRGEKPVLTVANTMGSFIEDYVKDHELKSGDAIDISFQELMLRYLERSREVLVGNPYGQKTRIRLTDAQLGPRATALWEKVKEDIKNSAALREIPLSPIDFIKRRIEKEGYSMGEITGRQFTMDYATKVPTFRKRTDSIGKRKATIAAYNAGQTDAILINQAGATGLSLHASEKFKDQRRRHMVIIQAEGNIDTHMQVLGRINRTGQVSKEGKAPAGKPAVFGLPRYTQLVADVPAEKRPAAVLAKKMASLNANTTASRGSAVTAKDVVDFMNEYGDQVAANFIENNEDINVLLDDPLKDNEDGIGKQVEEAMRKVTGRIPLLPIATQEQVYDQLEADYRALLEEKDRLGENALEAKTLDLDAKLVNTVPVFEGQGGDSPFGAGAVAEISDVKKLGKAYSSAEIMTLLRGALGHGDDDTASLEELQDAGETHTEALARKMKGDFTAYREEALATAAPDARRQTEVRLDALRDRLTVALAAAPLGRMVSLKTRFGDVPAMVVRIEVKGKPKNPAAVGSWMFTFAVADAVRHVTLPASKLYTSANMPSKDADPGAIVIDFYEKPEHLRSKPVLAVFDEQESTSREVRVIITGNLFAGYQKFHRGRIIHFTTDDGSVRQGILMPQNFNLDRELNAQPVEFEDADTAIAFLEFLTRKGTATRLRSEADKVFSVAQIGGGRDFRIAVAASREMGGKIYLNPEIRRAAGQDFVKASQTMRVDLPRERAVATLQAMIDAGHKVVVDSHMEEAKAFKAARKPVVRGALSGERVPESKWLSAREVSDEVAKLTAKFAHKPTVIVADRTAEVVPSATVNDDWTSGMTYDGNVYLFREGLANLDEVRRTAWHEFFHYGLRRFLTKEQYIARMLELRASDAEIKRRSDEWVGSREGQELSRTEAIEYVRARGVDEALAALAEQVGGVDSADGLAKHGPIAASIRAVARWAAAVADRFGAKDVAAWFRGLTNEEARRFVRDVFAKLERGDRPTKRGEQFGADPTFAQPRTAAQRMAGDTSLTDKVVSAPFRLARWDALANAAWEKLALLNEKLTDKSRLYETIRAGVEDRYGLEEAYVDRRVELQVNLQRWARGAKTMIDKIGELSREESRVAYEWMHEREADDLIDALPAQSKQTLRELKELIRSLGEEAVRLGQLSQEVFERNELAYLHRSYVRHELEASLAERIGTKKAIAVWAEQYKGRGLTQWLTLADLKARAGGIDIDPTGMKGRKFHRLELRAETKEDATGDLSALGGRRKLGRLRKYAYWPVEEAIPEAFNGWRNDGQWEVRWHHSGKWGLWRDLTKEERQALGEIDEVRFGVAKTLHLMTHDIEVGRMQEWVAKQYGVAKPPEDAMVVSANESLAATFGRNTWVKVPATEVKGTNVRKYGALAGLYVPGPVWNDVRQHVGLGNEKGDVRRLWDEAMRLWKVSKTALSPGVHTNNVMANFFIADFHDLRSKDLVKAMRVLFNARFAKQPAKDNADLYRRFEDSGAMHGTFKYHELKAETLDPLLDQIRKDAIGNEQDAMTRALSVLSWANRAAAGAKAVPGAMVEAYQLEDEVFRLAIFLKGTRNGLSDLEAGKLARKSFLDYDINAPWIQALRASAFPFIAFPYRAIPMLLDTFTRKPWKLVKYVALAAVLDNLAYAMLALGDDDEERERRLLPEERAGKVWGLFPKMLRMPWNSAAEFGEAAERFMSGDTDGASRALKKGHPVFLDVRRWYPAGDVFDVGGTHAVIPWSPTALPGGPMALIAELFSNKAAFTGQPITKETDTGLDMARKVGLHLYRFAMPNLFMIPGTWSFEGLRGALGLGDAGKVTDVFGREMSVPQAAGSALGVKVGTYPEDVLRYNVARRAQALQSEIMANIYKMQGERQRNKISDAEFREGVARELEKIKKLGDETTKKLSPPRP